MLAFHDQRLLWHSVLSVAFCVMDIAHAQTTQSSGPFLNVNGKYVLYSYPAAPYAKRGVVYAPLVSFSELLGIRVAQVAKSGRVTFLLNGQNSIFRTVGNHLVDASTGQWRIPIERLPNGEWAVALPPLLDALKITYRTDTNGLRITDQRFLNQQIPLGAKFSYANGLANRYKDWDYYFVDQAFPESLNFVPTQFSLIQAPQLRTVEARFKLKQPRRIGSGVSILTYISNGAIAVKGDGLKPPPEPPALPASSFCQYSDMNVFCKYKINFKFSNDVHIQYILAHAFNTP